LTVAKINISGEIWSGRKKFLGGEQRKSKDRSAQDFREVFSFSPSVQKLRGNEGALPKKGKGEDVKKNLVIGNSQSRKTPSIGPGGMDHQDLPSG